MYSQFGPCDSTVPVYVVDLNDNADSIWTQPNIMRDGSCCGYSHPPNSCVKFIVTLDDEASGIIFNVVDGAMPQNLEWQLMNPNGTECDPTTYPAGVAVCLDGQGPHTIIFCKPGGNNNTYSITSVPGPSISGDIILNDGCSGSISTSGFDISTLQYNSIYPGTFGQYNYTLSCTTACETANATGQPSYPPYIDYQVCGSALGSCNIGFSICDTVRINYNPVLAVTINPDTPVICYGNNSITLNAFGSGGYPPYSYIWSTGDTTTSITVGVGTYSVTLIDGTDCPAASDVITVSYFAVPISVNAGVDQMVCTNSIPVMLNGTVAGASGASWTGGSGTFNPSANSLNCSYTPSASEMANGGFTLSLISTGNGSCPADTDDIHITLFVYQATMADSLDVSCFGANDGYALASGLSGTPPIQYLWSNGATTPGNNNLNGGFYTITVSDAAGCMDVLSVSIYEPTQINATLTSTITPCQTTEGSATISPSGGVPPYTYLWNDSAFQTTQTATNLGTGLYTVTVTDFAGCSQIFDIAVNNEGPPYVGISSFEMVSCFGGSDGSATALLTMAGVPPHTYLWSDPQNQTTETATGLAAGTYTVVVTDALNCAGSAVVTITESTELTALVSSGNISCYGLNDGNASVTASGGTPPYTYIWSNSSTNASILNLTQGTYTITIKDTNDCELIKSVTIDEPIAVTANINYVNHCTCYGISNGSISVSGISGTPPYLYSWSSGQFTSSVTALSPGLQTVTITDNNGCLAETTITVLQPDLLQISGTTSNILCFGQTTGQIDITVSGGTSPFLYGWSNGSISEDAIFIEAGSYSVSVYDANGCNTSQSFSVTQPTPTTIYANVQEISCYGSEDGAISTIVSGGVPPYAYLWSSGQSTNNISNLEPGVYTLTVTDANFCTAVITRVIADPPPFTSDITYISNYNGYGVPCYGDTIGFANLIVSGGVLPYTYFWSNNSTYIDLYNVSAGSYSVTITDAHGCTTFADTIISQPPQLHNPVEVTNVLCYGNATGAADMTITGGLSPYSVIWSTTDYTEDLTNLTAGIYVVEVRDINNCIAKDTVYITQPPELLLTCSPDTSICKNTQAVMHAYVIGGVTPYNYFWNSTSGLEILTITPGNDTILNVHVVDNNGCVSDTLTTRIYTSPALTLSVTTPNDSVCLGGSTQLNAIVSGGVNNQIGLFYNNQPVTFPITITPIATQDWIYMAKDSCNTKAWDTIRIYALPVPVITDIDITDVVCNGAFTGAIDITPAGGTAPYSYFWSNTETTQDLVNVSAGTYIIEVRDANNCNVFDSATITQPTPMVLTSSPDLYICKNTSTTITANASGGVSPYSYYWNGNPGINTLTISPQNDTIIYIYFTDVNNCVSDSVTTVVTIAPVIDLQLTVPNDSLCIGTSTEITASSVGGYNGSFTLFYENEEVTSPYPINPNLTLTWIFTAKDTCNFSSTDSVKVWVLPVPAITGSSVTNVLCNGASTGAIDISVAGGTPGYFYFWNNGMITEDITNVPAGTYNILVKDIYNCSDIDTMTIYEPPPILLTSSPDILVCKNSFVTISTSVNGGTPGYNYFWNNQPGFNSMTLAATADTVFFIYVKDNNNCTSDTISSLVNIVPQINLSLSSPNDSVCLGGSTQITATLTGGYNGPYTLYHDNIVVTSPYTITPNNTFDWIFMAKDTCNLNSYDTMKIVVLPVPSISGISVTNALCYGSATGGVDISTSGGSPGYTYLWNNGANTQDLTNVTAGIYFVLVRDLFMCSDSDTMTITQPPPIVINSTPDLLICKNSTVTLNAIATGGVPAFNYFWNNTSGMSSLTITPATDTTFYIHAIDNNNCSSDTISTIINTVPSINLSLYTPNDSVCIGEATQIIASVSGNYNGSYSLYQDNQPVSSPYTITPLSTTNLVFTAIDSCNISASSSITIYALPVPAITGALITNVLCNGDSTGAIDVSVSGGTPDYTFSWSSTDTTEDLINTTAGIYVVQVRDIFNCTDTDTFTILQPPPLSITCSNDTLVCKNTSVALWANTNGGVAPYLYYWNNSQGLSNFNITAISDTTISVYGKDVNGCNSDILNINVLTIPSVNLTMSASNDSVCIGNSTQLISSITGGYLGAYTLFYNNQEITSPYTINPVVTQNLIFMATDSCNISDYDTIQITVLQQPILTGVLVSNALCNGDSTGNINLTVSGGTPGYSYFWNTTATTEDLLNVPAGTYFVSVRDTFNCSVSDTFIIYQPEPLLLTGSQDTLVCPGKPTQLSASANGGVTPYTFYWNGMPGLSINTVSSMHDTIFTIYVKDANGCISNNITSSMHTHPLVSLSVFTTNDSICAGTSTQVYAQISGGVGEPYTFLNSNMEEIFSPHIVIPNNTGDWIFIAQDTCGTKAYDTITIHTLTVPTIIIEADIYSGCIPLTVNFTGTTIPECQNYHWSFGEQDALSFNKNPTYTFKNEGVYDISLSVTTPEGCSQGIQINDLINAYPKPESRFAFDPIAPSIANSLVSFHNYSSSETMSIWAFGDGDSSSTENPSHIYQLVGDYIIYLYVMNIFGCKDTSSAPIKIRDEFTFYAPTSFSPDHNDINEYFSVYGYGIDPNNFILLIYDRWGEVIFQTTKLHETATGGQYSEPWDGSVKGKKSTVAKMDTYTWTVQYKDIKGAFKQRSGPIFVIR
ncbi:MAG: hypothetical protein A2275_02370 [Bacteroidetes bacterium RIFOXYA12_FULL_35_11]|nr:MAG: hypothetical protein A2X01_03770 [Bacteroidetes bacterium GWF2_35_48]OFY75258.1 MAG: hypothetical protein A2275_02370 [Bacteroidetes bacterium RIFOXYA12_FULL_35_11]